MDMVTGLRDRLAKLTTAHEKDVERFSKRATASNPDQVEQEQRSLEERRRRLTFHNILRVTLVVGYVEIGRMKDNDLLDLMVDNGVVRGRPRRAS